MSNPLCEPQIMTIQEGVLARTPSEHAFPIGVVGRDEAEARQRFNEALERWEKWATLTEQRLQAVKGRPGEGDSEWVRYE
jgi:hypothetical protein